MEPLWEDLQRQGIRLTPQRQRILEILSRSKTALSAQQVLQEVRRSFPHVSLDTVYRNLSLLTRCGLLVQLNLQNRETARFEFQPRRRHHHHLVCLKCGRTVCLPDCLLDTQAVKQAQEHGFQVTGHAFEVYGYCPQCRVERPAAERQPNRPANHHEMQLPVKQETGGSGHGEAGHP